VLGGVNRGTRPCRSEVGDDDPRTAVVAVKRPQSRKSEWSARVSVVSRDGSGGPGRLATRNAPTPSRLPPRVQGGAVCVSTSAPPRGTDGVPRWVQPWHQGARERPGRSVQVLPRVGVPRPPRALKILDPVSPPSQQLISVGVGGWVKIEIDQRGARAVWVCEGRCVCPEAASGCAAGEGGACVAHAPIPLR